MIALLIEILCFIFNIILYAVFGICALVFAFFALLLLIEAIDIFIFKKGD